jgi:XTP/dITP diphosphohydrolase
MILIFATHNEGKIKEMKKILAGTPWEILSAEEAGVLEDPEETGITFAENAFLKAKFVADIKHEWTVADDSGLCVEALGGAPGVFSARWAGAEATGEEKAEKVLRELANISAINRNAYFESSLALIAPSGEHWIFTGQAHGKIATEKSEKFARPHLPYDAIFIPENFDKTFGEMTDEEKNALSHRGEAFRKLKEFLMSNKI